MPYTDKQLESSIASMLLTGVVLSAALVLLGGILYLHTQGATTPDYRHFSPGTYTLPSFTHILRGIAALDAASIIQFGLLVLVATPVVRVGYCIVGFLRQRDGLYVAISALVLAVLLYSLTAGAR